MKNLILLTLALFSLSCCAQNKTNKNINNKKNKAMYIDLLRNKPEVSKDFETFDRSLLEKFPHESGFLQDGTYIDYSLKQYTYPDWCYITPKNSCFSIVMRYYQNGNIKEKGLGYNESAGSDAKFGVWYYFDENGNFLREINHEKDCNVNFEQIYYICSKEEIPLSIGYADTFSNDYTEISKYQNAQTGHWYWIIRYHKSLYSQFLQIKIDGETGKIIDRQNIQIVTGEGMSQTETNVIDEQQPEKKEGFWKRNFGI